MLAFLRRGTLPILSLIIMMLGNSLLTALIPVRLSQEGFSEFLVAAIFSGFALGFVIGSFRMDRLIAKVGHIRSYSGFASIFSASILVLAFTDSMALWMVMRVLHGMCMAGLCVIIQSWLLSFGTKATSGRILSIYMISFYGANALGVHLMVLHPITSPLHFCVAAMLCSLSILPLSLTQLKNPSIETQKPKSFYSLYKHSPSSILGCFGAGVLIGSIFGLWPYYAAEEGFTPGQITRIFSLTILGGISLQYPIGQFSDLWDRRRVMVCVSLGAAAVSALLLFLSPQQEFLLALAYTVFGGLTFTLYPLCINYARNVIDEDIVLSATQGLLLAYSVGRAAGPQIASCFMAALGSKGIFVHFITMTLGLAFFFKWRLKQNTTPLEEDQKKE